jgi:hypothetical protein
MLLLAGHAVAGSMLPGPNAGPPDSGTKLPGPVAAPPGPNAAPPGPNARLHDPNIPTHAAVQAAVDALRRDPNLGRDKTIKSLRWVDEKNASSPPAEAPAWIVGLFQFLSQTGSVLLWVAGGIGLAVAGVWIYRLIIARQTARAAPPVTPISYIQQLDIRPASLPDDVGAAALALLADGQTREALSLLYRGALSRMVHRFSVAIGESFTEGEALRAVKQRLDQPRAQYFDALVGLRQRAVYAAEKLPSESIAGLCREFSPILGSGPI